MSVRQEQDKWVIEGRWSKLDQSWAANQGWCIYWTFADGRFNRSMSQSGTSDQWRIGINTDVTNIAGHLEPDDDADDYVEQVVQIRAMEGDDLCARAWAMMVEQKLMGRIDTVDVIKSILES